MIRLAIAVEGETEEEFVKRVLAEHLRGHGVEPFPILPHGRGGNISVARLAPAMAELIWSFDFVTSLVDFYGFKEKGGATPGELEQRINQEVRSRIRQSWDESRVFAYVQRHEFEGLLFSDTSRFGAVLDDIPGNTLDALRAIRRQFATPEDINDSPATAPSKRIAELIPHYDKRVHSPEVAMTTGLGIIRQECVGFDGWLTRLESLGGSPQADPPQ